LIGNTGNIVGEFIEEYELTYAVLLVDGLVDVVATCNDGVETLQFIFPVYLLNPNI
jgi:hypothetical protein